ALVASCGTPETLRQRLEDNQDRRRQWSLSVAADCDELAALLAGQAPETPLSQDDWEQLQARLGEKEYHGHELSINRVGGTRQLDLCERTEQASLAIPRGTTEEALADWLTPETRSRVPIDRHPDLEAAARSLLSSRPHRMGGYHDGVQ
ncbi:hypothetical protein, partial [Rhodopseudomonas sp. BR0G17]|uniref:hypothetical protein n=1 Tax=Rhodopseudomonas sp. BR0G17 TaxID=2269368 RepID=UPI0013DFECB8